MCDIWIQPLNETRALGVKPRPSIFSWIGPKNGNVLFWHGNGYLHGNTLGLNKPGAEEHVVNYLKRLEDEVYPHHIVEVRNHGEKHDNAPPALWVCRAVQKWNAAHPIGPKLRLVTPSQWFEEVAANWPTSITKHRAGLVG